MKHYFTPDKIKGPWNIYLGDHKIIDMNRWQCWFCITDTYEFEWYYQNPDGKTLKLVKSFL